VKLLASNAEVTELEAVPGPFTTKSLLNPVKAKVLI
jgi:hypothetical protein